MKPHGVRFFVCAVTAMVLAIGLRAADTVVYKSDFLRQRGSWEGRPSSGAVPPGVDLNKTDGVYCLQVKTDGKVGSGFHWTCPVPLKPGLPYKLSFRIKRSATELVVYRITDTDGTRAGDESKAWQRIANPEDTDLGNWMPVEFIFTPLAPGIGVDIAAGADHTGFPFDIYISDFKIESFQ